MSDPRQPGESWREGFMAAGLVKSVEKALDEETDMGRKKSGQGTVVVVGQDEVPVGRGAAAPTGEATLRIESLADVAAAGVASELPTEASLPAALPAAAASVEQLLAYRAAAREEARVLRDLLAAAEADISACIKRQHHVPDKALLEQIRAKLAESGA